MVLSGADTDGCGAAAVVEIYAEIEDRWRRQMIESDPEIMMGKPAGPFRDADYGRVDSGEARRRRK
jgi:hypothetical protein